MTEPTTPVPPTAAVSLEPQPAVDGLPNPVPIYDASGAEGLELKARFSMPRARVQPERYREFVDFATRVDRAEARSAEIHANP